MQSVSRTVGLLVTHSVDRRLLQEFVEGLGLDACPVRPDEEPLERWQRISLILMSQDAARRWGPVLLARKARQGQPSTPLLVLLPREADATPWLEAGFDDVLRQPITKAELKARLKAFLHLREASEERYATLFEHVPVGVYRLAPDGRFLRANPALLQMLGYSSLDALNAAGGLRRIHAGAVEVEASSFHSALSAEATWVRRDGQPIVVRDRRVFVAGENEQALYYEGLVEDVTEEKKVQQQLVAAKERAEEMAYLKSVFLANMSHEIRTPLTGIIGFASLLARQVPEAHRDFAARIEASGKRLLETLNAVLTLAKLEADRVELKLEPVRVAEEVRGVVALFQKRAEREGLALALATSPEAAHAEACLDRGALASVVQNLLSNAIKFTEEGRIDVQVEVEEVREFALQVPEACARQERQNGVPAEPAPSATEACLTIRVRDTGVGIDPEFLPHLFEEFRQESSGWSRSREGSGLGLTITKRLTELMGGTIHAESVKGEGSVFSVRFPRLGPLAPAPKAELDRAEAEQPAPARQARLLIVEDNEDTRLLLTALFAPHYDVVLTVDAAEALSLARAQRFDVIFLDINLGEGHSGLDILDRLRAWPAYQEVPVVAMTGYAMPGDRERFLRAGFTAHVPKPFDVNELLDLTARLVEEA